MFFFTLCLSAYCLTADNQDIIRKFFSCPHALTIILPSFVITNLIIISAYKRVKMKGKMSPTSRPTKLARVGLNPIIVELSLSLSDSKFNPQASSRAQTYWLVWWVYKLTTQVKYYKSLLVLHLTLISYFLTSNIRYKER